MSNPSIQIRTQNAQLNIKNNMRHFRIKRTPPQMEMTRKTPSFKVNWDKVRAQSGLKNPKYFMEDNRQKAYDKVMNYISRVAQEGDMMTEIDNASPDNMISVIAEQNMRAALPEVNMGTMPEDLAVITWDKGAFEINWTKGSLEIVWDDDYMPDISVTPYSVEISIRNLGKIKMRDQGAKLEGRKVDKKI